MCVLLPHSAKKCRELETFFLPGHQSLLFLCKSSRNGQNKSGKWHLEPWTIGFYMVSNGKNIDLNDKGCVEPTSLIIKSTCLIICFSLIFFFYKVSIKNRFLYKMLFFLLHLLQVQQHMMAITMMGTVMKMIKTNIMKSGGNLPGRDVQEDTQSRTSQTCPLNGCCCESTPHLREWI